MSAADDNNDQQSGGGEEMKSNINIECTSCEQNNVNNITEGIDVAILEDMTACASCGKEGNSHDMNVCNKCKMVKYCNASCKKKHRTKHKKACERRVAELHDEQLFKEVEPEECPICMLPIPIEDSASMFNSCCGKTICIGCIYAIETSEGKDICPFCRTPPPSSHEEGTKRIHKLMDNGNGEAYYLLAGYYAHGMHGLPQDRQKANELYLKGGELGSATAYYNLGQYYRGGEGVEVDMKKANYYYEFAAMCGVVQARHNLGCEEWERGNKHRAMRHFVIAAKAGYKGSLDNVKVGFRNGLVTKDEYANTLRAYHERQKEMKSEERDKAAASGRFSRV